MKSRSRFLRIYRAGFTLIEILVVTVVISFLTTYILSSFSKNRVNLERSASLIMAGIRQAQSFAVSAKTIPTVVPFPMSAWGTLRCGFGIRYTNSTTIDIYAGADSQTTNCAADDRDYEVADGDFIYETIKIADPKVEFAAPFNDIFFEPPDPRTYLCTGACFGVCGDTCASLSTVNPIIITVREIGTTACNAATPCKYIHVYTSGKIELQ